MPELPEVEIARRQLARWSAGGRVQSVRIEDVAVVRRKRSTRPSDADPAGPSTLRRELVGRRMSTPVRVGKRLGWPLDEGRGLQVHLGMTGLWVRRDGDQIPRFGRWGLKINDRWLWFVDARRFGCVVLSQRLTADLQEGLGPDALDFPITGEELGQRLRGRRVVKVALMDQSVLAGLGNIQAAEALWRAGVHPDQRCVDLSADQLERLAAEIPRQLAECVQSQDTEEMHYLTQGGDNPFCVYGRDGQACVRCGSTVAKGRHGGRATFWCPACQPSPG